MKAKYFLIILSGFIFQGYVLALPGDVNENSTIDIIDALLVAQYYVGLNPAGFNLQAADVNASGTVDIVDALLIAEYYVGLITEFPVQNGVTTHDPEFYRSNDNYTIHHPFPQAEIIKNRGIRPAVYDQAEMNAHCQKAFEDWVKYWITTDNCPAGSARPHMGPGPSLPFYAEPYGTISEFIGWGMLVCVLMDNDQNRTRNLFGLLNSFRKAFTNEYGLMMSTVNFHKPMDSYNKDSATEADENMAMALLMAHYQWGSNGSSNYLTEAAGLLNSISAHLVERPAYVLKPAATWGGSDSLDPCYYDPMYYPLWYSLTGDSCWTKLDEHYRTLVSFFCSQYGTGLLPEWCRADGSSTPAGGNGLGDNSYIFSWDAHQISTKWAIHYAWWGTAETDIFFKAARMAAAWVEKEAKGNLSSLVDSYTLDGEPVGTYSYLPAMVGAMGLAGTVSAEHQDLVNKAYEFLLTLDSGADYNWGNSMGKVVQLLVYSGNFVNFSDTDSE